MRVSRRGKSVFYIPNARRLMTTHLALIRQDDRQDDTQPAYPPSHISIVRLDMLMRADPKHGVTETRENRFRTNGIGQNRQFIIATIAQKCMRRRRVNER